MRRLIVFILACLLCGATAYAVTPSDAAQSAVWRLNGAWLVTVNSSERERFLIISGAKAEDSLVTVESATYGYLDGKGKPVTRWEGRIGPTGLEVKFITPGRSTIRATFANEQETANGSMATENGRELVVRLTRIEPIELETLREVKRERSKDDQLSGIRKDSPIRLVYVGASDCWACRGYEAGYFGRLNRMAEAIPDFAKVDYVRASLASHRGVLTPGTFPSGLEWLAGADANGRPVLRKHGTPFFAAVVDDRVIAQGHGISGLEALVAPAIRRAISVRSSLP